MVLKVLKRKKVSHEVINGYEVIAFIVLNRNIIK